MTPQLSPFIRLVDNPDFRFSTQEIEWLDFQPLHLEIYEENCRTIITENRSPDISMRFSVNPYRGCFHGCSYCYARPSHQYLDFGAGTDFERKIVVKVNAADALRQTFRAKKWQGDPITFSGNTDCYQPLELKYELTRRCLEVCAEFKNPVQIITKGALIERDIDLLCKLNREASVTVIASIAFIDDKISKEIEPGAPRPSRRFAMMKRLNEAGIPLALALAPVIPGLNDYQIPEILERAKDCGATQAFMTLVRLPMEVKQTFIKKIEATFPTKSRKIISSIRKMKGGHLNRSTFGQRMSGEGQEWESVHWLFESTCKKFGINSENESRYHTKSANTFCRPTNQLSLF